MDGQMGGIQGVQDSNLSIFSTSSFRVFEIFLFLARHFGFFEGVGSNWELFGTEVDQGEINFLKTLQFYRNF